MEIKSENPTLGELGVKFSDAQLLAVQRAIHISGAGDHPAPDRKTIPHFRARYVIDCCVSTLKLRKGNREWLLQALDEIRNAAIRARSN